MPMYLLSVCYPAGLQAPEPEVLEQIMIEMNAVGTAMVEQGVWVFAGGLHDQTTATTVVDHNGELTLSDGPFIASKEQIGGVTIIDVAGLDETIGWARRQSAASGTPIEVRPFIYATSR